MSKMSLKLTMDRIEIASKQSPIVVCLCDSPYIVDTFFGATVMSQRMIENKDPSIIGVYDKSMGLQSVEKEIRAALKGEWDKDRERNGWYE